MRQNIFLDLDQTLLSAENLGDFDVQNDDGKIYLFKRHVMNNKYIIFERPGLQEFLDYVFENFDVSIWTAASREYANFVIKNLFEIKSNRKIKYLLTSDECAISVEFGNSMKDLSLLQPLFGLDATLENSILIDDLEETCIKQPFNCIFISAFYYNTNDSWNDKVLSNLINKFKKKSIFSYTLGNNYSIWNQCCCQN